MHGKILCPTFLEKNIFRKVFTYLMENACRVNAVTVARIRFAHPPDNVSARAKPKVDDAIDALIMQNCWIEKP